MNELSVVDKEAEWRRMKSLVLDSVSFPITKRVYNMALDEFSSWSLLNSPDITTQHLRARAIIIAMPLSCALRPCVWAALTDGRSSGGFTPGGDGRRTARECAGAVGLSACDFRCDFRPCFGAPLPP